MEISFYLATYFFLVFLFFSFNSLFLSWILIELITLNFVLLMESNNSKNSSFSLYYFLVQTLGSLIFLCSLSSSAFMTKSFLIVISLVLKLGMIPFFVWSLKISFFLDNLVFVFFLTIQKLPLIFLLFNLSSLLMFYLILLSSLVGSFFLLKFSNIGSSLKLILLSSSMYSLFWIYFIFWSSAISLTFFFLIYTVLLLYICSNFIQGFDFLISFIVLMGFPPFSFFFFKFLSFSSLTLFFGWIDLFLLWFMVFFSFMGYFNYIYSNFFMNEISFKKFELKSEANKNLLFFFVITSFLFLMF